jgi:hypothetical protein
MKNTKLQMFPAQGEINIVFNQFANFINNRKSQCEKTEIIYVKKLERLQGITNTPMTLLQNRINNFEIDYKQICWGAGLINEMKDIILKHSTKY